MQGKPTIAISMGDPSGIGPEVTLKALASHKIRGLANYLLVGDAFVIERALGNIKGQKTKLTFYLLDLGNVTKKGFSFGKLKPSYGKASFEYIQKALELVSSKVADAMVTAPINKQALFKAGLNWSGHTEFLKHFTKTKEVAMMLVGGPLRVVLVTRHIALKSVAKSLKREDIFTVIKLTHEHLRKKIKIRNPKIAVCGLNPHAGEGEVFGNEEIKIISPAIKKAEQNKMKLIFGPLASDALFYSARKGDFDAVVCMYHDQGLIPLKMIARDSGVNITLGLPFVRTCPAHGTAFDIAGNAKANPNSMIAAIEMAVRLCK